MNIDRPTGNRLTGMYRGRVIKHVPNGFCKVYIPGVYPEELKDKPDALPDAEIACSLFGSGNYGNGGFSYPDVGTTVLCMFLNDDQNYPIVMAASLAGRQANDQYNSLDTFRDPADEDYYDFAVSDPGKRIQCSRSQIDMTHDGAIQATVGKHLKNASDDPRQPYSQSLNTFNLLVSRGLVTGGKFVYHKRAGDKSMTIKCYEIKRNRVDDESIHSWYSDTPDTSMKCAGIMASLVSKGKEEEELTVAKFASAITTSDSAQKLIFHNYQFPKDPNDSQKAKLPYRKTPDRGVKRVFISLDGSDDNTEVAEKLNVDIYMSNGAPFGMTPEYWDKTFQGTTYPLYDPLILGPQLILPIKFRNLNMIIVDPSVVETSVWISKDGSKTESIYDTQHQYQQHSQTSTPGSTVCEKFKQSVEDNTAVQGVISSFQYSIDESNLSDLSQRSLRKSMAYDDIKLRVRSISALDECNEEGEYHSHHELSSDYFKAEVTTKDRFIEGLELDHGLKVKEANHIQTRCISGTSEDSTWITKYQNGVKTSSVSAINQLDCSDISGKVFHELIKVNNGGRQEWVSICCDVNGKMQIQSTHEVEVIVECPQSRGQRSYYQLKSDGSISLVGTQSITLDAPTINLQGTTCNQKFSSTNITSTTTHNGDTTINGSETVTVDSTIGGVSYNSHRHFVGTYPTTTRL